MARNSHSRTPPDTSRNEGGTQGRADGPEERVELGDGPLRRRVLHVLVHRVAEVQQRRRDETPLSPRRSRPRPAGGGRRARVEWERVHAQLRVHRAARAVREHERHALHEEPEPQLHEEPVGLQLLHLPYDGEPGARRVVLQEPEVQGHLIREPHVYEVRALDVPPCRHSRPGEGQGARGEVPVGEGRLGAGRGGRRVVDLPLVVVAELALPGQRVQLVQEVRPGVVEVVVPQHEGRAWLHHLDSLRETPPPVCVPARRRRGRDGDASGAGWAPGGPWTPRLDEHLGHEVHVDAPGPELAEDPRVLAQWSPGPATGL